MVDRTALLRACTAFTRTILRRYEIGEVLYRLTDQVTEVLGVSGAGVSLAEGGRLRFVAATDPAVVTIEEAQVEIADGPCHDAWRTAEVVIESDLARAQRWPAYAAVALATGQRAVAGVPMMVAGERIGAVNIYHTRPYRWPVEDLEAARLLADMTAGYIVNQRTLEHSQRLTQQLQQALDSRILIEQAKGVLAERHGLDLASAFELLRQHARSHNRTVNAVARDVVRGTLDL